jgi:chromosome segregation ATPase
LYNSAERALIEEIRRETSFRIEEKEKEINIISSLLEEISAELRELYSGSRKLSPDEQKAAENRLKSLQEDYLAMMGHLQDERSRILEESRARETEVQTQIENRTRQSTPGAARGTVDAAHEMDRLSGEQRQSAAVEAQMVAFFSNLNGQIAENKFDEAAGTVQAMKDFLNTPAFQTLRSMRERKDIYAQAINSFEAMIHEARPGKQDITAGPPPQNDPNIEKMLADLEEKNAMLEQDLAGKNRTIAALNSGSSGSARLIAEKDRQITALNSGNNNLNRTIAEKDRQIAVLNSGNDNLNRTIAEKDRQITALNSGNADLNRTVKTQGDSLDKIKGIVWDKDLDDMSFNEIRDSVAQIQRALESLQ